MSRHTGDLRPTVAGEDLGVLVEAFQRIKLREAPDGMFKGTFRLPAALGDPFVRALQRVEAELLLEDADMIGVTPYCDRRTEAQRRADAMVLLVTRVAAALGTAG